MSEPNRKTSAPETETVICRICGEAYRHPKDAVAGFGRCLDCWEAEVEIEMANSQDRASSAL